MHIIELFEKEVQRSKTVIMQIHNSLQHFVCIFFKLKHLYRILITTESFSNYEKISTTCPLPGFSFGTSRDTTGPYF